jgi:acetyl esterase/lipase
MPYNFDPELEVALPFLPVPGVPVDIATSREMMAAVVDVMNANVDLSGLTVDDHHIRASDPDRDILVRVYSPDIDSGLRPGVLDIHGGGFTTGSVALQHGMVSNIAREVDAVVATVEYRLAPEDPFPAGLEDCYATLEWLHRESESLGIDQSRIAILGGSAGGGLAAALALLSRDRKGPPICFQLLAIPELDDRLETVSMRTFVDTPVFDRTGAEQSWNAYLGSERGEVPYYAAPSRAPDLSGLPSAFISTMEFDPLRDEGILYGLRLLEAGVAVELHQYPGTFHGSAMVTDADVSLRQTAETVDVLRRALRHPPAPTS